jgi:hypothetical protein
MAQLPRGAVDRQPSTQPGHLIHKIHQSQIEVIFNQGKRAQADSFAGAAVNLFQCSTSGTLAGRVNQNQVATLQMSGRLAVRDADDLFVSRRLAVKHVASEAKTGLDVREMLRDTVVGLIERHAQENAAIKETHRLGR